MKIDLHSYQPKKEEISIPEWADEPIFVRELSADNLEMLQRHTEMVKGQPVMKHQYSLLIISSLVDKDDNYLFSENDIEDLEKQPAVLIAKLMEAINRVSGIVASNI